jgi:hypothetical protein
LLLVEKGGGLFGDKNDAVGADSMGADRIIHCLCMLPARFFGVSASNTFAAATTHNFPAGFITDRCHRSPLS